MAVGFDTQINFAQGGGGLSFTTSLLTVGSGSNRALGVSVELDIAASGFSITWNGTPLTLVSSTSVSDATNSSVMAIYGLINPASGNFALAGSWTGASNIVIEAISYTGVDQTSVAVAFPHGNTASGNSGTATVVITSSTGNAVIATFAAIGSAFTGTSGTNTYIDSTNLTAFAAGSRDVGSASVSMTASLTSSGTWVCNGCDVLASASTLTLNAQQRIMM